MSRSDEIRSLSRRSRLVEMPKGEMPLEPASDGPAAAAGERTNCPFCDEDISARAKKCRHCGEILDVTMRMADEARRASEKGGNVYMNAATAPLTRDYTRTKSKVAAFLLAWLLGGIGGHKFYLNRVGQGILYLLFCWTFIPAMIAFVEGIVYITMDEERFWQKYG